MANNIDGHVAQCQPINAQLQEIPRWLSHYCSTKRRRFSRAKVLGQSDRRACTLIGMKFSRHFCHIFSNHIESGAILGLGRSGDIDEQPDPCHIQSQVPRLAYAYVARTSSNLGDSAHLWLCLDIRMTKDSQPSGSKYTGRNFNHAGTHSVRSQAY